MRPAYFRIQKARTSCGERGQSMTIVLLVLGLFLLGAVGLAVDVSNWWVHKQMAQGAADAACTAGGMDLLVNAEGSGPVGSFPTGSPPAAYWCSSAGGAASATCKYAALNGYDGAGRVAGQPSNDVQVTFPGSVPGVSACGPGAPPPCVPGSVANPFIQVNVLDRTQATFTGLLSGSRTTDVAGSAVCGVLRAQSPVPIIVLNPSCQHAFQLSGGPTVKVVGGPPRSIQVNSSCLSGSPTANCTSCAAATSNASSQCNSSNAGTIDLSKGGPNFSGSDFGVFGTPKSPPAGFNGGTSGTWATASPISDPYAQVAAPAPSSLPVNPPVLTVPKGTGGCPDHTKDCKRYQPGIYDSAITVKNETAIFDPGIYYIKGTVNDNCGEPGTGCVSKPTGQCHYGLDVDSNGVVRPNLAVTGNGNGVMFYFSGASGAGSYGSSFFGSNAGKASSRTIDPFITANANCPGADPFPLQLNLPPTVSGNVLLGQCTSDGTYIAPGGTNTGSIRGLIFFQDRANADNHGQASMQGGGGLVISGSMYFHNCNSSGTGTGCSAPTAGYNAFFQLQGTPGGATYVLGNITADELVLGGNGNISMALNPNAVFNILKVSLLQ